MPRGNRNAPFRFYPSLNFPFQHPLPPFSRHSLVETVGGVDDVINDGGLLLVERLHGSAAAVVLNPLQNQTHDVDAEPTKEKLLIIFDTMIVKCF